MSSEHSNLLEQGIEAFKKVFSSSNNSADENAIQQNLPTNNTVSNSKMAKDTENNDDHKKAEPRYNGLLVAGMRVAELKSALDKLGVGSKRTDKKADLEAALIAALEEHLTSPAGKRSKSIPAPLSSSKAGAGVRSMSSPPAAGRSLRSAGYQLRSREGSSTRGTSSRSKAAESSAGHIKATVATSNKGSYEENDMVYYSVKAGASKVMSRSPSVASRKSRARSVHSARSSQAKSEGEDDSSVESSEEEEENAPPTVRKQRATGPAPSRKDPTPVKRQPTPTRREPTPSRKAPTPSKKEPTPKKREPTPSKKEPTPKKREPAPQKKESTPNKKQRVQASPEAAAEVDGEDSQLESASGEESEGEAQQAALNDSGNFFDAQDGAGEHDHYGADEGEGAYLYEEGLESLEQQGLAEGDEEDAEGPGSEEGEEGSEEEDGGEDGDMEVIEVEVVHDEEYSDSDSDADADEADAARDEELVEDDEEGEEEDSDEDGSEGEMEEGSAGEGEGEYSDEDSQDDEGDDGDSEQDSEDGSEEGFTFGDGGNPTQPGDVIDLMDSSDEGESETEYVSPAFPEFSFSAPKTVPGATLTASTAPFPTFNFSVGSSATKPAKGAVSYGFNGLPLTAPAAAPKPALDFSTFTFPMPAPVVAAPAKAVAPVVAAKPFPPFEFGAPPKPFPVASSVPAFPAAAPVPPPVPAPAPAPAADLSPAALAFTKLSNNFVSVFANNLTNNKKEKLSAEEYSLLKSLLESSKPTEVAEEEAKSKMDVVQVQSPKIDKTAPAKESEAATGSAKKAPLPALDTKLPSAEKNVNHGQENKENKTKSISFDPRSTAIPRTSFEGAGWNSRESFLPSPPETPASAALPQVGDADFSGKLFADNAPQRLAHRMPTPYHAAKRTAFHAGWTGGSEVSVGQEDEEFMTLPPSKRQSLGGYRSIQYRQATPGAAYVNANRLSVGSGMLSDTPDSTWSAGSNLRTSSARSSISGYPSGLPQPAFGSHLGGAAYTPMFRNNAARFTPLSGPQYPASAVASNAAQAPAVTSAGFGSAANENRVSRLPVSARSSIGSVTASASKNLPATLSYIQRRKLQMQSDSGASAAVAKKILDTLGGLSTPMEEQRQKPMAITWHGDVTDKVTEAPASVLTSAITSANTRDGTKVAHTVSFAGASPKPAAAEKEAPKTVAEATGVQSKSPYLHNSIRKQLDDHKDSSDKPPAFGFALPPQTTTASASASSGSASASSDEFSFTEPTEVSGVEGAMEETVDRATGVMKRRVSAPIDTSVKYIFSAPNTTRKTQAAAQVAPTASSAASKPAAATAAPSASASSSSSSTGINIWAASSINDGVKCKTCLSKNKAGATKCASCENPIDGAKPAAASAPTAVAPAAAAASPGINIWAASSINDGVKCKTCLSKNKAGATKCASCENPIGDAAPSTTAPAAAKAPGSIGDGGFTFGAPAVAASKTPAVISDKGFSFGAPASEPPKAATTTSSDTGFSFGSTKAPAAAVTFGAPAASAGGGFTFGAPAAAADKPKEATKAAPAAFEGFTFGAVAAPAAKDKETPAPVVATPAAAAVPGSFTFGSSSAATPAAAAPFSSTSTPAFGSFGAAPTPAPAVTAAASNPFASSLAPATGASFGASAKRSADAEAPREKDESDEQPSRKRKEEPSSSAPSFPAFGATSTPFGAFPAAPAAAAHAFKPMEAEISGFGGAKPATYTPSASTSALPSLPAFGSFAPAPVVEKKTDAPAAPFTFGATAPTETPAFVPSAAATTGFAFGASTATTAKPADQPFMFGSSAPAAAKPAEAEKTPAPFTFGGASTAKEMPAAPAFGGFGAAPAASSSTFSFDKPAMISTSAAPALGFGAATATAAPATSGFSFGATSTASTAGKPPLASNSLGGSTLSFPQAGVAAVDARANPSNGSTMDTGSFSNQSAPAANIGGGNPFSSAFSGSSTNLAANPFPAAGGFGGAAPAGAPFTFPGAPAAAPSSGLGSALGNTSSGGFGGFGSSNNLASAAPAFGAGAFGAPAAVSNPFGGPAPAAVNPFSNQSAGAFGAAPAAGLQSVGSSSNLFGGAPAGGLPMGGGMGGSAPFGGNTMGGFGGGAFGSTGSLQSVGSAGGMGGMGNMGGMGSNSGGMGGFGLQAQSSVDSGAGGFSLGATGKSADIAGRRKVKVKGRP